MPAKDFGMPNGAVGVREHIPPIPSRTTIPIEPFELPNLISGGWIAISPA